MASFSFTYPLLLIALVTLPLIWWFLRYTPPRPIREVFPPTRILRDMVPVEETRATSPWWLTLLRMAIAALVIIALARPVLNPTPARLTGDGPLFIILDNGWASAPIWNQQVAMANTLINEADGANRLIQIVGTAQTAAIAPAGNAKEARDHLASLRPQPHRPDRVGLLTRLAALDRTDKPGEIIWLSDGIDHGNAADFATGLKTAAASADIVRIEPGAAGLPMVVGPVRLNGPTIEAAIRRADGAVPVSATLRLIDTKGDVVDRQTLTLAAGETEAETSFTLPIDLRNTISHVDLSSARHAGGVRLIDDSLKHRVVGLISGGSRDLAQPLLDPLHYIRAALAGGADLRAAATANTDEQVRELTGEPVSAIVMADIGTIPGSATTPLQDWIDAGGTLVRFAGPRLAGGGDTLLPVALRAGNRILGGALSWSNPQGIGGFQKGSPFDGLAVPKDIRVNQQVLAEPTAGLSDATWAWLADGTPLVTAERRGQGWIVLFHITADARWSDLPISGTFEAMLRRIITPDQTTSNGAALAGEAQATPRPWRLLDSFGQLVAAPGDAKPLPPQMGPRASADTPPGLYRGGGRQRAINALANDDGLERIASGLPGTRQSYPGDTARSLWPLVLLAATILLILDTIVVALLGGFAALRRRLGTTAILFAIGMTDPNAQAQAQAQAQTQTQTVDDATALAALSKTSLAYVLTGDSAVDDISRAGLKGLSMALAARTAFEPGPPIGLDPARDEMSFYTLIYWPISENSAAVSDTAIQRIDAFMKQGGTVLFDTRDQLDIALQGNRSANGQRLAELLADLDLPELEPTPLDHVVAKSFYLLQDFPGRYQGAPLWVERINRTDNESARPAYGGDGVSPLLVTGNDFAAAWAIDDLGQPMFAVTPGGERQREMSYRVGINIVMYTLTGNYKADQVHIPALLERLGQ